MITEAPPVSPPSRPVWAFLVRFVLLCLLFYSLLLMPWMDRVILSNYLSVNARATAALMRGLGEPAVVTHASILIGQVKIVVRRGCDALEPTALLAAALWSFPAPWRRRLVGFCVGAALLAVLNLIRLASLCWVRVHWPQSFHTLHLEVWPILFVLVTVAYWLRWVRFLDSSASQNAIN